jgi:hypothetical protein
MRLVYLCGWWVGGWVVAVVVVDREGGRGRSIAVVSCLLCDHGVRTKTWYRQRLNT